MAFALRPGERTQREVRRVSAEELDIAIRHLDEILGNRESVDVQRAVHAVREHCTSIRGLARLVKPALGDDFKQFDRTVKEASRALSLPRHTRAVLAAFDNLAATRSEADEILTEMRARFESLGPPGVLAAAPDDGSIERSRSLLVEARTESQRWRIPRGFDTFESGVAATYRRGRRSLRRADAEPTDHRIHELRKNVEYLRCQMQLLHDAAPSVLVPLVHQFDVLAQALGDDRDLAVVVDLLDADPAACGSECAVAHVRELARERQTALRTVTLRAGATLYAEPHRVFARRIARYWQITVGAGRELSIVDPTRSGGATAPVPERSMIERERRFLIDAVPERLDDVTAVSMRQGYLAANDRSSVRVRDAGAEGCTLTIKAGEGAERTELEWPIERREFDAAWPHTVDRRVEKLRYRIPHPDDGVAHVIELDVFGGVLTGLVIAEVEFDSGETLAAFNRPGWFGREVTDDGRYSNASLALHGLPPLTAG